MICTNRSGKFILNVLLCQVGFPVEIVEHCKQNEILNDNEN
jgi:hypothetical protein